MHTVVTKAMAFGVSRYIDAYIQINFCECLQSVYAEELVVKHLKCVHLKNIRGKASLLLHALRCQQQLGRTFAYVHVSGIPK